MRSVPNRAGSRRLAALLLAATLAAGCELTEVTTAEPVDVLVVESVLRTDRDVQRVLLHRTLQGRTVPGARGATVRVRGDDGRVVPFAEAPLEGCVTLDPRLLRGDDSLRVRATCYESSRSQGPWVQPGMAYELSVETREGERVRGVTRVPGAFRIVGLRNAARDPATGFVHCFLPPDTSFELTWSSSAGTWAYLTEMEVNGLRQALAGRGIDNVPEPLRLVGVSVSEADTTVRVPGEVGTFDRFSYSQDLLRAIRDGFPEGVQVQLLVAATDRNFMNAVRGGEFNPSGTVRASSVVGDGVGLFGSIAPLRLFVDVRGGPTTYPCLDG